MLSLIATRIPPDLTFDNVCRFLVNDTYPGRLILSESSVFVSVRPMISYFEMKSVNSA